MSYPIYVIDNKPPAFFTVYLTACQFIKINIYSTFKYCQQRSNDNDLFLLNESSHPPCNIKNDHNLLQLYAKKKKTTNKRKKTAGARQNQIVEILLNY